MPKLPDPSPIRIQSEEPAYVDEDRVLWRLHQPTGPHPTRWDQLRSTCGVGYFGFDIPTCLAEVFQSNRHISTIHGAPQLSAFAPSRPLRLLDLRGGWPVLIGASHAINSGPKNRCRAWAGAIRTAHPDADGLLYTGMAGSDCVVLFAPPGDFFPPTPGFTKPLSDPGLASRLADAATQIGYALD